MEAELERRENDLRDLNGQVGTYATNARALDRKIMERDAQVTRNLWLKQPD